MTTELVLSARAESFMPIMRLDEAKMRRNALVGFVRDMLTINHDFGNIPGTDKPTLLKPGAEKLVTFFGLTPVFVSERITEDFGDGGTEPLFFYRYRCELYRDGTLLGTGIGSCNSRESKYRYRNADRVCPSCGKPAIIKGKADYGGGWLCFAKKGGCGAKFKAGDAAIEGQATGKVSNPDIADLVNTIDKMAQKRALIAATLIAVNASEFFTQDVEDMVIDAEYTVSSTNGGAGHTPTVSVVEQPINLRNESIPDNGHGTGNGHSTGKAKVSAGTLRRLHAVGTEFYGAKWDDERPRLVGIVTTGAATSSSDLTEKEAIALINGMEKKMRERVAPNGDEREPADNPFVDEAEAVPA